MTPDGKMPGELKSSLREIQNYLGIICGNKTDETSAQIRTLATGF
jgi:hypothetical protein